MEAFRKTVVEDREIEIEGKKYFVTFEIEFRANETTSHDRDIPEYFEAEIDEKSIGITDSEAYAYDEDDNWFDDSFINKYYKEITSQINLKKECENFYNEPCWE